MTLPGGGRSAAVGAAAVMLTEYAPITVINISTARVWVADNSGVSPQNGVPVDPGTSLPWKPSGEIWAVLDPAASGTVTVVITNAVDEWQPSPATIATEVAQQLLLTGVPSVLTETVIFDGIVGINQVLAGIDISGYATLIMSAVPRSSTLPPIAAAPIQLYAEMDRSNFGGGQTWSFDAFAAGLSGDPFQVSIPVNGSDFTLTNQSAGLCYVRLVGTNRPVPKMTSATQDSAPQSWALTSTALAAGTIYNLTNPQANAGIRSQLNGRCRATLMIDAGSTAKGEFLLQFRQGGTLYQTQIADTTQTDLHASGSKQILYVDLFVPINEYRIGFACRTAGTTSLAAILFPGS